VLCGHVMYRQGDRDMEGCIKVSNLEFKVNQDRYFISTRISSGNSAVLVYPIST
jgi:hypothetical protein